MKLSDAPAKDKAVADLVLAKVNKAGINRFGVYRNWESRKQKVRVKLWGVHSTTLEHRAALSALGFLPMRGPSRVNSMVAYVNHEDLAKIEAVDVLAPPPIPAAPARRVNGRTFKSSHTPKAGETWYIDNREVHVVAIVKDDRLGEMAVIHYGDANYAELKRIDKFRQVARKSKH